MQFRRLSRREYSPESLSLFGRALDIRVAGYDRVCLAGASVKCGSCRRGHGMSRSVVTWCIVAQWCVTGTMLSTPGHTV